MFLKTSKKKKQRKEPCNFIALKAGKKKINVAYKTDGKSVVAVWCRLCIHIDEIKAGTVTHLKANQRRRAKEDG